MQRLEDLEISQAEFARRAGVSAKHVNQVLSGKSSMPLAGWDYWVFVLGCWWDVELSAP